MNDLRRGCDSLDTFRALAVLLVIAEASCAPDREPKPASADQPLVFGEATLVDVGGYVRSLRVVDFDGDGKLDLLTSVIEDLQTAPRPSFTVSFGLGSARFEEPVVFPERAGLLEVADFDHDGRVDLISRGLGQEIEVHVNDGDRGLLPRTTWTCIVDADSAVARDFDGDGHMDLAIVGLGPDLRSHIVVLPGQGDGTFADPLDTSFRGEASSIVSGDFDQDGVYDLAVLRTSNGAAPHELLVFSNDGLGRFTLAEAYSLPSDPFCLAGGDFDGEGDEDLAVISVESLSASVYFGAAGNTFVPQSTPIPLPGFPLSSSVADVDGDGSDDLLVSCNPDLPIVAYDISPQSFGEHSLFQVDRDTGPAALGDLDGDGKLDLIFGETDDGIGATTSAMFLLQQ